ncbi:MAG: DUF996 domain-containing protein [Crenarchaeota archaeon]|nr:DUF996 domain-containing protein [Thermoproteota archaeon]
MTLETNKILGGLGAILLFISALPISSFMGVLGLIGAVLILVSLYGLAGYYKEPKIFRNALYGIITGIIGVVIAAIVIFVLLWASMQTLMYQLYPNWDGNPASLSGFVPDASAIQNMDINTILALLVGFLGILVIIWISAIIASIFVRRSLGYLSDKSSVGLFRTAGLLFLIGACLTIVFIGIILIWIAVLLLAIAFLQLKSTEYVNYPPPPAY